MTNGQFYGLAVLIFSSHVMSDNQRIFWTIFFIVSGVIDYVVTH